jgi:lipoyl(octanoyl) transferase
MTPCLQPAEPAHPPCHCHWLGLIHYQAAWDLQKTLAERRGQGQSADTLLLLEHPPTYTLGACGDETHLLVGSEVLARQGVTLVRVDRGGDITFHGPGQLVGYPVLDLSVRRGSVARYLRDLEEVLVRALAKLGVIAGRLRGHTGVWVGDEKIAAIGVKVNARKITSHGFALNVATDLHYFTQIVPCGIRDKGVTSMVRVLGRSIPLPEVVEQVVGCFGQVLGFEMIKINEQFAETNRQADVHNRVQGLG